MGFLRTFLIKKIVLLITLFFLFVFSLNLVFSVEENQIDILYLEVTDQIFYLADNDLPYQKLNDSLKIVTSLRQRGELNKSYSLLRNISYESEQVSYVGSRLKQLENLIGTNESEGLILQSDFLNLEQEFLLGNLDFVKGELADIEDELFESLISDINPLHENILADMNLMSFNGSDIYDDYLDSYENAIESNDFAEMISFKKEKKELFLELEILVNRSLKISELESKDFPLERINMTFLRLLSSFQSQDDILFEEILSELDSLFEFLKRADSEINYAEEYLVQLEDKGVLVEDKILLEDAKNEFRYGNFDGSYSLANEFVEELSKIEESQILFGILNTKRTTASLKRFLLNFWWVIVVVFLIAYSVLKFLKKKLLEQAIQNNKRNIFAMPSLRKKLQTKYYIDKIIDKESFEAQNKYFDEQEFKLQTKKDILNKKSLSLESDLFFKIVGKFRKLNFFSKKKT